MIAPSCILRIETAPENRLARVLADFGVETSAAGMLHCIYPDRHYRGDQVPSTRIYEDEGRLHCFGCHTRTTLLALVQYKRGCSSTDAWLWLADRARVAIEYRSAATVNADAATALEMHALTVLAIEAERSLSSGGRQYLLDRALLAEVIQKQHLGYIAGADDYDRICKIVAEQCPKVSLKAAGITSLYTFAKDNIPFITIPYIGAVKVEGGKERRECIRIKARRIDGGSDPKYVVAGGGKALLLYNASALDDSDTIFICEGELDTLAAIANGFPAVGIAGVNGFHPSWADLFRDKTVYLALDGDPPGRRAARDIAKQLLGVARSVRMVAFPSGADVTDVLCGRVGA